MTPEGQNQARLRERGVGGCLVYSRQRLLKAVDKWVAPP